MLNKIFLVVGLLAAVSFGAAAQAAPEALTPEALVKDLYRAQKAEKGPFFETKNRALVDKYFTKSLATLIWNDAVAAAGEVGAIEFDPTYGMQDNAVTDFAITPAAKADGDKTSVLVTFKYNGKKETVTYQMEREGESWKIADIRYSQMKESLKQTLQAAVAANKS